MSRLNVILIVVSGVAIIATTLITYGYLQQRDAATTSKQRLISCELTLNNARRMVTSHAEVTEELVLDAAERRCDIRVAAVRGELIACEERCELTAVLSEDHEALLRCYREMTGNEPPPQ